MNRVSAPLELYLDGQNNVTTLLGVLWASGGLVVLLSAPFGTYDNGFFAGILAVAGGALALGAVLLSRRDRPLSGVTAVALALLGAVAISTVIGWSGPIGVGAVATLYVYVAVFAFVALRRFALPVVGASALLHGAVLWWIDQPGAAGTWTLIWGVAVTTGLLAGRVVGTLERVASEQERLVDQLRDIDATKTGFLRAVGHELGGPTTAIAGLAETVAARGDQLPSEQRAELLTRIAARTHELQHMMESLLELREATAGRTAPAFVDVHLDTIVANAVALCGIEPDRVRTAGLDRTLSGDPAALTHAVSNLLSNANKYAPPGSPVDVSAEDWDQVVVVRVDDCGPGIPDRAKWRIFEPLGRARPEDAAHGTGVGLSIVRQFARLHGGDAWAEDRSGGGTRMSIAIPEPHRTDDLLGGSAAESSVADS